jgi:hypothetical protein
MVLVELRDAEIAEAVSAPPNVAPSVYVEVEGEMIQLVDDGFGADEAANDGVFTAESRVSAPPSDAYCLSGSENDEARDVASPDEPGSDHEPGEVQQAFQTSMDPQALPPSGSGCHDWKYAWSGYVQVWYCDCFSWDVWSC